MEKSIQRKNILSILNKMSEEEHSRKSSAVIANLWNDPAFVRAEVVGVTISAFPEVDTVKLIEKCWQAGKRVAVPKCQPLTRLMDFYIIENLGQLETVYMKLLEPKVSETEYISPAKINLMIVPGVAFAKNGYRIGFGGGYYDRYLADYSGITRSLAFSCQIVDSVPVEEHDIPVEGIYTENGYIDAGKVNG